MSEENIKKTLSKIVSEMDDMNDVFGPMLLLTLPTYINSSRKIINILNVNHANNIRKPDFPKVYTGYEYHLGQSSEMLSKEDEGFTVVRKFVRNKFNYLLLIKTDSGKYKILERKEIEEFSDGTGTEYNNELLDSLDIGSTVEAETTTHKSTSFDKRELYRLGKELNTIFTTWTCVEEDSLVVTEHTSEMMDTVNQKSVKLYLNPDHIIVQEFPDIGEEIPEGLLCALRKVNTDSILYSGKNKNTNRLMMGDQCKYAHGYVYDIDITVNTSLSNYKSGKKLERVKKMARDIISFYRELHKECDRLIRTEERENLDDSIFKWKFESIKRIDSSSYCKDREDIFGNILIEIKIKEDKPLLIGSKLTNTCGGKGCISYIQSKKEIWKTESGKPVHIVAGACSVIGRLNVEQLVRQMLAALSQTAQEEIIKSLEGYEELEILEGMFQITTDMMESLDEDDVDNRLRLVYKFFKSIDAPDAKFFKHTIETASKKDKKKLIKQILENGIYIMQHPSAPSTPMDLENSYDEYGVNMEHIVFPDGSKSLRKVLVAPIYWYRLKQDPEHKFATRGKSTINPITHLPSKTYMHKRADVMHSNSATKIGTYETVNLLLCGRPEAVSLMYAILGTSLQAKEKVACLYQEEFTREKIEEIISDIHEGQRKTMENLTGGFHILGIEMGEATKKQK
jgi:hypothetical protein